MQQYNSVPPVKATPVRKINLKIILVGVLVLAISTLLGIQFLQKKTPPESSLPPASPPPPVNRPPGESQASQIFIWDGVVVSEPTTPIFLHTITAPLTIFSEINDLVILLGFTESDKSIDDPTQKVWSNNFGSLSAGTLPQYFTYTSSEVKGTALDKTKLFSAFTSLDKIEIGTPFVAGTTILNRVTGISSTIQVETYEVHQKIDGYPLVSSSRPNIGSLVFNQATGGLMSIRIAGGYRDFRAEGSVTGLTREELILKASRAALGISIDATISDRQERNNTPQRVNLSSVDIVYYNNPNDAFIRPGYLLTGMNQNNQKVVYFVPML